MKGHWVVSRVHEAAWDKASSQKGGGFVEDSVTASGAVHPLAYPPTPSEGQHSLSGTWSGEDRKRRP